MSPNEKPIPHSPEWFDAVTSVDPGQAIRTAAIIRATDSDLVCSVCGHRSYKDFRLKAGEATAGGPATTLRLCEDCRDEFGGDYVPLEG